MFPRRTGQIVGGYRLIQPIASGGMGELWRASKEGLSASHVVALKLLKPKLAEDEHFVALFRAEARLATRLRHPRVVQISDSGQDGDVLWFAMELVSGADLKSVAHASKGGIPYQLVLFIAWELLEALQFAHELKGPDGKSLELVHRDVKPDNILIALDGYVKLADFGIAKAYAESTLEGAGTGAGKFRGTAGYIAPEIIRLNAPASVKSDLFALGVVLWEAIARRQLFGGKNRIRATADGVIPRFVDVGVPGIPSDVEAFVHRLLAPDPADRFDSAAAALLALRVLPGARDASTSDLRAYIATLPLTNAALLSMEDPDAIPEMINDALITASKSGPGASSPQLPAWRAAVPSGRTSPDMSGPTTPVPKPLEVGAEDVSIKTSRTSDTAGSAAGEVSSGRGVHGPRFARWIAAAAALIGVAVAVATLKLSGGSNAHTPEKTSGSAAEQGAASTAMPAPPSVAHPSAVFDAGMAGIAVSTPPLDASLSSNADASLPAQSVQPRHKTKRAATHSDPPSKKVDDFEDLRVEDPE